MPIDIAIDPARRLVRARAHGRLTAEDLFGYQREVWSRPDVAGFDELVDMTDVKEVVYEGPDSMRRLASVSAGMDAGRPSKLAIVAPGDAHFGLGRMYEAFRALEPRSTRVVSVFRNVDEAMAWLGGA